MTSTGKNMGNINELNGKMDGTVEMVNTTQREDAREKEKEAENEKAMTV